MSEQRIDDLVEPPAHGGSAAGAVQATQRPRRSGARRLIDSGLNGLGSLRTRTDDDRDDDGSEGGPDDELLDRIAADRGAQPPASPRRRTWFARLFGGVFGTLSRRIVALNVTALVVLVTGVLYMSNFRESLLEAQIETLNTQAGIIAGALAARAQIRPGPLLDEPERLMVIEGDDPGAPRSAAEEIEFPLNPEIVSQVLGNVNELVDVRVRVYNLDGQETIDTKSLFQKDPALVRAERNLDGLVEAGDANWNVVSYGTDPLVPPRKEPSWLGWGLSRLVGLLTDRNLPLYTDHPGADGTKYREVARVIEGTPKASMTRMTENGELILSAAVPIRRFRQTLGVVFLTTPAGLVDSEISDQRWNIATVFLFATAITMVLSILLASTIATPLRRLAQAADRVRRKAKDREEIPDYTDRQDEIGHLSGALRDMTRSLYSRIEAIERFAADVAHELKNPLTSLRSAVETLPLTRTDEQRGRLLEVINHDVQRLDRLISDISDASRLDAEMAREDYEEVDLAHMLRMVHASAEQVMRAKQRQGERTPRLVLNIDDEVRHEGDGRGGRAVEYRRILVRGHEGRLGQVVANLVSNARSFVPPDTGWIAIDLRTRNPEGDDRPAQAVLTIADNGPGIPPDKKSKIFDRFYTDRPEGEAFGNNSGLGLSIVKQIVESHGGTIHADNWTLDDRFESDVEADGGADESRRGGAIFTVTLPLHDPERD